NTTDEWTGSIEYESACWRDSAFEDVSGIAASRRAEPRSTRQWHMGSTFLSGTGERATSYRGRSGVDNPGSGGVGSGPGAKMLRAERIRGAGFGVSGYS